ncbi:hypothetical protein MCOR27_005750 [Pyricularia oryzae]|uniref:1,3-beta-glucanosyltransferase n=1 Tax=Pyricularia grisea TaxID=148305 RepID=A0ABQ8N3F1_PYRGI|nr:hypothetical protein MCOR01_006326 [Pyricularia oryzae]KAI6290276.1 hypothetical protein MCOR33_011407 [Pyricularia grisea]KAI6259541.1 hypothetical protein MCOR19_004082 [Pyricularia oryzae]KAI6275889.1 hypothetical protein MCOR26_005864 [Pyricularia oryzae]KAI6278130.1 hypothetical protein MCOR27_005750 [Pyricularia oryzae]
MLVKSSLIALGAASIAAAVKPVVVKDNHFVNPENGSRFQIIGVAYQPGGSAGYKPESGIDPLSNADVCLRDAALIQSLGANAIRVYNLNPNLNHDECASIFNAAGIYMVLDVNSPLVGESITSHNPWESYYGSYVNRTLAVVEAFKDYPNTLAFFSGNEVIANVDTGATVPPYIRAVTRDLKNYIAKHSKRPIPVGYSAADVRSVLFDSFEYFQCAIDGKSDDMSRADLFALNSYSWCGDSSFTKSGYDQLVAGFKGTSVPVFFSEYGCNTPSPRIFTEVGAIYGDQMNTVFSGGVVYEYVQEPNNFGLVEINNDGSVTVLDDYFTLKDQIAKLDFKKVQGVSAAAGQSAAPPKCDTGLIKEKGFNNNFTLPVPPPGVPEMLQDGIKPAPVGKLVDIKSWKVTHPIKTKAGKSIDGLEVKKLANDAINQPGSNSGTGSGTPSSGASAGGASASPDKKDAAGNVRVGFATVFVSAAAAAACAVFVF